MCFVNLGFTSHMMSTKGPVSFKITRLSSGNDACKYAPETSATATSLPLNVSITNVRRIDSSEAVGDAKLSPSFTYFLCLEQFAQVRPFIFPHRFSAIKFTASRASVLSFAVNSLNFIG